MISVSGKIWTEQKVNKNLVEKYKQDYGLGDILSKLIISRNYDTSEIYGIKNTQKLINIFNDNYDFKKAASILLDTIKKNENICIVGDYDVDGACATSLLIRYFNYINQNHFYYIPDRTNDGYGVSIKLFQKLIIKKPKLIIMVDCGSTSKEAIDFLNSLNIKSIIIDHHEIHKPYPKSNVIINPKKGLTKNESILLCATALTYFFIDILIKKTKSNFKLSNFLIYVSLATVCDVMPLRKINKIIISNTINKFNLKDNLAIDTIFNQLKIKKKISIDDLGFLIGPIINSGGRLNYSNYGTELLSSDDHEIIKDRSYKLIKLNNKRKKIEQNLFDEIDFKQIYKKNEDVIIYYKDNLNEGLIGIIASRLKEYFNKPAIVITSSNNLLKASARSNQYYNIGYVVKSLIDNNIIDKGGGHSMAAGFTMKKDKLIKLKDFIFKDYLSKNKNSTFSFKYDSEILPTAINKEFNNEISKLSPFGNDNTCPLFLIKDLKIIKVNVIEKKHISVILKPKIGRSIKSISFNSFNTQIGDILISYKKNIHVIAQIHENNWNNKRDLQLNIRDILISIN